MAARSLDLQPGDEVLSTDLEYGACDLLWDRICAETGARYVRTAIPLPVAHADDVVEAVFAHRTERTRIVFVSHVTSATALLLPVEAIVARARAEGLVTIVDGAHAPSQVAVDLEALGADFYAGNCNKWLCAPKGTGFLHARPERQERVDGAIVSWGDAEPSTFISRTELQGTRDAAAYLAVPAAIDFQRDRGWDDVRQRCRALAAEARAELCALLGTEPVAAPELVRADGERATAAGLRRRGALAAVVRRPSRRDPGDAAGTRPAPHLGRGLHDPGRRRAAARRASARAQRCPRLTVSPTAPCGPRTVPRGGLWLYTRSG